MKSFVIVTCVFLLTSSSLADDLPTLYQFYISGGIENGLNDSTTTFTLNNKEITLYGGTIHYFRVPRQYWRDRLRKARAAGLNAVETYVPWNLHEPHKNVFDFGEGGSDFQDFLDVKEFLTIAQEEDLFAIVRPGPFICAEWEFGGMPSWLLTLDNMQVRTSNQVFLDRVRSYFTQLFAVLKPLQFTKGGPIIALQVENEYASTYDGLTPIDKEYLQTLEQMFRDNGIVELLFTSDNDQSFPASLPELLTTVNFGSSPDTALDALQKFQPDKPSMVMEYWTGWYDHWTDSHHTRSADDFANVYEDILKRNASVNMYMFLGGTSFGFTSGGNDGSADNANLQPDTTSYDYDAPLTEAGDYTEKYYRVMDLLAKYNNVKTKLPPLPELQNRSAYNTINITQQLTIDQLISQSSYSKSFDNVLAMEMLDINNNSGQSFGYIAYTKTSLDIPANSTIKIEGRICDTLLLLIDDVLYTKVLESEDDLNGFGYWRWKDSSINLTNSDLHNVSLQLIVENWARSNFGGLHSFNQHKGLWQGNVSLNDKTLNDWTITPLEFKTSWTNNLKNWDNFANDNRSPKLLKAELEVTDPKDTYIDMSEWNKGIVIVNGFVLGRYLNFGATRSLYLPGPFLKNGTNDIIVFEHFKGSNNVKFNSEPLYKL